MTERLITSVVHKAQHLLGPEFAAHVRPHAERHVSGLNRIRQAVATGKNRAIREAQNRLLRSYSSKLVCLVQCLHAHPDVSVDWIAGTAAKLDPFVDCG